MIALIYDTETSGLPEYGWPASHPGQPHLMQLTAIVCENREKVASFSAYVQCPEEPQVGALRAHGITREMTMRLGVPLEAATGVFSHFVQMADCVVAHNEPFDHKIMNIAFSNGGPFTPPDPFGEGDAIVNELKKKRFCTQRLSTKLCNIPPTGPMLRTGLNVPKSPTLAEAVKILLGVDLAGAHNSRNDTVFCMRLWHWLVEKGHVS